MLKTVSAYINAIGALVYQGTWDALTNSPFLQSSVGNKGDYYVVSVAGTTNLNGITDWQLNDIAVFNGAVWQKIDSSNAVLSVNGQTGAVVLTASDVGATANTTYVLAGAGITGGGQLNGNVTITNSGVLSFNTRTGNVTLSGTDVTTALGYTPGTGNVSSVSASSPVVSSGGNTPVISMAKANATVDGYLSSTDWNTFNNKQPAGSYVTSVGATAPVASTGGTTPTISIPAANATVDGYLTSTDWNTFNSKQPAGSYVTSVSGSSGRITSTGGTTPVIDLANTTVIAGSYGNASTVGTFSVDSYGRFTAAANTAIAISVAAVSGAVANTTQVIAGTGLSGGGALSTNVTLNVTANSTQQLVGVQNNGVGFATRQTINFVPGTNITIVGVDDSANNRANVTLSVSGFGTMATQNANDVSITGGNVTANIAVTNTTNASATFATSSLPLVPEGYVIVSIGGVLKKIPYYGV